MNIYDITDITIKDENMKSLDVYGAYVSNDRKYLYAQLEDRHELILIRFDYYKYRDEISYNRDDGVVISHANTFKFSDDGKILLVEYAHFPQDEYEHVIDIYDIIDDRFVKRDYNIFLGNSRYVDGEITMIDMIFSKDNTKIAFHFEVEYGNVYIIIYDTTKDTDLVCDVTDTPVAGIAFTPSGNHLVYCTFKRMYIEGTYFLESHSEDEDIFQPLSDLEYGDTDREHQENDYEDEETDYYIIKKITRTENEIRESGGIVYKIFFLENGDIGYLIRDYTSNNTFLIIKGDGHSPIIINDTKLWVDGDIYINNDVITTTGDRRNNMIVYTPNSVYPIDIRCFKSNMSKAGIACVAYDSKLKVLNRYADEQIITFIESVIKKNMVWDPSIKDTSKMLGKPGFDIISYFAKKRLDMIRYNEE